MISRGIFTIWFRIDLSAFIWINTVAVQEPFNVWFWVSRCTGRESCFHAFINFNIANFLQEFRRLSFWSFVTKNGIKSSLAFHFGQLNEKYFTVYRQRPYAPVCYLRLQYSWPHIDKYQYLLMCSF